MVEHSPAALHRGYRNWLVQRVSAVIMVIYTLLLLAILTFQSPLQYSVWKELFSYQWMRFASFFFLLSMFAHAWIGIHDILVDYIHSAGIRLGLQAAVIFALLVYTVWSFQILWGA